MTAPEPAPAEIAPTDEVVPVATGAEYSEDYWNHLIDAVHQAYDYARTRQDNDPRGAPGTITWSAAYYGANPPKLGAHPSGWDS